MDWVNWPFNALCVATDALWLFAFLLHLRLMKMPHTITLMMSTASTTGTRMMTGFKPSSSTVPVVGSSNAGSCKEIVSQTPNVSTISNTCILHHARITLPLELSVFPEPRSPSTVVSTSTAVSPGNWTAEGETLFIYWFILSMSSNWCTCCLLFSQPNY